MSKSKNVVVIDYGMGNIWSVLSALDFLGAEAIVSSDPSVIVDAEALVLPGVGSFRLAMRALVASKLNDSIKEAVAIKRRKILGICLGFQLLGESSTEDGLCAGLGFIPEKVKRFNSEELSGRKLPHVGFNEVFFSNRSGFFGGFSGSADFYFVHSYRMLPGILPGAKAICNYGVDFLAAYQNDNVYGTQFHPEKSQTNGLKLLDNFLSA